MQVYSTENEQMDQVLNFVKKYGLTGLLAVIVFLGVYWAKNYYDNYQSKNLSEASTLYDKLTKAQKSKVKIAYANDLLKNFESTIYSKFAAITLGKEAVIEKNYDKAIEHYSWVYQNSNEWEQLRAMAFENWARVLLIQDKAQEALDKLNHENALSKKYSMMFSNLEGDIYTQLGQKDKAVISYNKALTLIESNPMLIQSVKPFYDFVLLKKNELQ